MIIGLYLLLLHTKPMWIKFSVQNMCSHSWHPEPAIKISFDVFSKRLNAILQDYNYIHSVFFFCYSGLCFPKALQRNDHHYAVHFFFFSDLDLLYHVTMTVTAFSIQKCNPRPTPSVWHYTSVWVSKSEKETRRNSGLCLTRSLEVGGKGGNIILIWFGICLLHPRVPLGPASSVYIYSASTSHIDPCVHS